MNAAQRKQLDKIIGDLEQLKSEVETMQGEEQDKFDNLSEGLRQAEKGKKIEEAASELSNADNALQEAIDALSNAKGDA